MSVFSIQRYRSALKSLVSGRGLRAQLVRGGFGSGAVKAAGTLLSLVVALVLARVLGPAGYGIYSYVFALVGILSVPAQFGLPQLVVRETANAHAVADWSAVKGIWRWAGSLAVVLSLLLAFAGGAAVWMLGERLGGVQVATLAWGLVLLPVIVLARLRGAALRGLRHVVAGQLPDMVLRPGLLAILVLVLVLGFGEVVTASRAMALHALAATSALLVGAVLLLRVRPSELGSVQPRFSHRAWGRALIPLGLTAGMMVITRQSDIVLLGLFVEVEQVGIYRVAASASLLVAFGLEAVGAVVAPQIARLYARGELRQLQRLATACSRVSLAVALPAALVFVLYGEWLLGVVVGVEYAGGAAALAILAGGQLVNAGMGLVGLLLNMTGHETVVTRTLALAALGHIVANLLLIPVWGMNGAAVATAGTFILWNLLLARAVSKRLGIASAPFGIGRR
jgi:O-antigen/teichoic acid export membrane protein